MSIIAYVGLPGCGKTYGVVENVILPAFEAGREVWTNIPMNPLEVYAKYPSSVLVQFDNDELNGEFLMGIPGGSIVVIDEVWRFWPAGMKSSEVEKAQREFFAEHRHKVGLDGFTQEIALLTQNTSQMSRWLKDMLDKTTVIKKNDAVGSDKTFHWDVYAGSQVRGDSINKAVGRYKPEIFKFYKSHTKSETGTAGLEKRADNRANAWKHPFIRIGIPLIFLVGCLGAYGLYSMYAKQKAKSDATLSRSIEQPKIIVQPVQPISQNIQSIAVVQPKSVEPVESKTWRIVGQVSDGVNTLVIMSRKGLKHHSRRMNLRGCQSDTSGPVCIVGNEKVSYYSGISDDSATVLGEMDKAVQDVRSHDDSGGHHE